MVEMSLIALAAVSVCVSILCMVSVSTLRKKLQLTYDQLQKQSSMAHSGVLGVGQRVLELELRISQLREVQQEVNDGHQDYAYSTARSLLQKGLSDDAVSASTGLSISEVGLMKLMHTKKTARLDEAV